MEVASDNILSTRVESTEAVVSLPSDNEIKIVRTFRAAVGAVFDAWTNTDQISAWWDPRRFPLAICELDLHPGGAFRFVPGGPDGGGHPFAGQYLEILPPSRLVFSTPGVTPASETIGTLDFADSGGQTVLTITMTCATRADRDALLRARVDAGTIQSLNNLHSYLANAAAQPQQQSQLQPEDQ
ncbi:MAG: SRPBCC domain-containing protein [Gemmatimonadaceae bacterium]